MYVSRLHAAPYPPFTPTITFFGVTVRLGSVTSNLTFAVKSQTSPSLLSAVSKSDMKAIPSPSPFLSLTRTAPCFISLKDQTSTPDVSS